MTATPEPIFEGIEAVLLDLDGTLVDTAAVWHAAMAVTLAAASERYPSLRLLGSAAEVYDRIIWPFAAEHGAAAGGEWDDDFLRHAFRRMLAEHATADDAFAGELLATYVRERGSSGYQLFPDARPALDALRGRVRLGLVTNGPSEHQRSRIEPLGLDRYFDAIAVSGELGVRKPDPAIFAHVLGAMGVPPSAALHVGDDLDADVGGAKAAGLAAVWVNRGGRSPDGATPPDAEIISVAELPALLGLG